MSKHSLGPWKVVIYDEGFFSIEDANEHQLAEVYSKANAGPIAATPDLLDAAKKALEEMRHTIAPRSTFTDAVNMLDAAIAKAESDA